MSQLSFTGRQSGATQGAATTIHLVEQSIDEVDYSPSDGSQGESKYSPYIDACCKGPGLWTQSSREMPS